MKQKGISSKHEKKGHYQPKNYQYKSATSKISSNHEKTKITEDFQWRQDNLIVNGIIACACQSQQQAGLGDSGNLS